MICMRCGSGDVTVTSEQVSAKTSTKRMGILWRLGRLFLIYATFGLWLIIGRKKERSKTKFKHNTVAICQSCGKKWRVL